MHVYACQEQSFLQTLPKNLQLSSESKQAPNYFLYHQMDNLSALVQEPVACRARVNMSSPHSLADSCAQTTGTLQINLTA